MEAKIIAVGNLKGGVGKSTLTSIYATYIHNILKEPVVVIDADDLQHTIETIRKEEINAGADESILFPVLPSNSIDAPDWVGKLIDDFKFIFIDLPGNLKQEGVIKSLLMADVIIIPTSLSREDLDSTGKFINILQNEIIPKRKEKGFDTEVFGILYKVRKRGKEYKEFAEEIQNMPIRFFNEVVPNSEVLKRQTSTYENVEYASKSFEMKVLLEEFKSIL